MVFEVSHPLNSGDAGHDFALVGGNVIGMNLNVHVAGGGSVFADTYVPGHDDVRRDKAVVLDHRVVTDVVPAPHRNVAADLDERLNRVVLEDEAVVADRLVGQEGAL